MVEEINLLLLEASTYTMIAGLVVQSLYQLSKLAFQPEKRENWKDAVGPVIAGLVVTGLFWPHTIFDYLPFSPQWPSVAYLMTALIISRVANAEHESFKTIADFFAGLIGRFFPRIEG